MGVFKSISSRFPWPVILIALAVATFFGSIADFCFPEIKRVRPYQFPDDAWWILADGDDQAGASYRLDFEMPPFDVEHGWVCVAADSGFELILNGNPIGKWELYRGTRPFGS
ncbi:MAG: hypothetical protein AAF226_17305, partial [Verrucomicrobiota bacterium]